MKPRLHVSNLGVWSSVLMAAAWLVAPPVQARAQFTFTDVADEVSLVALWELNEAAGSSTVTDLGDAYTGNVFGGTTLGVPSAMTTLGTAAHFNGFSGKIDVPQATALNPQSYTIQAWAQVRGGAGTYRSPLTSRHNNPQQGYIFYAASNNNWEYWGGPGWVTTPGPAVILNQWVHLAATYDNDSRVRVFYLNGHPVATATGTTLQPNAVSPLRIGAGATEGSGGFWFNGAIDNVAVLNEALAHQNIANHYNAKSNYAVEVAADGPVAYWRLGEQAGTSAYNALDVTAHTGTYSNVTLRQRDTPIGNDIDTAAAFAISAEDPARVAVPYSAHLNPAGSFTIEAWARADAGQGDYRTVLSSSNTDGGSEGFALYASDANRWQFQVGTGTGTDWHITSGPNVALGQWVHLVGAYDAGTSTKTFYVNGVQVASVAGVGYAPNTTNDFFIGMGGNTGTEFPFGGLIDEVAVYDHALLRSAVNRHFLLGNAGAEFHHWVGDGGDQLWSNVDNWDPAGSPAGKIVVFDNAGASATAGDVTNTIGANVSVASMSYENTVGNYHTTVVEAGSTLTLAASPGTPRIYVAENARIDGQLGSSQGITKIGEGTLTLGGSGPVAAMNIGGTGVTVAEGTLRLNREGLPFDRGVFHESTSIRVESGATLEIANRWNVRQSSTVTVDGGTLTFTHSHGSRDDSETYLNTLHLIDATVTGHGIRLGNDSNVLFTVAGDAGTTMSTPLLLVNSSGNPRTLTIDVADGAAENDLIMSGTIYDYPGRGNNILVKTGAGTMVLSGANTYTGETVLSQGWLRTTHRTGFGATAVTIGDVNTGSHDVRLSLAADGISNNITVSDNGTGTVTLYGDAQSGSHTGTITLNRAAIFAVPTQGAETDWAYSFGAAGIAGAGPITVQGGSGATSAAAAGNRVVFNGDNTYTGGTTVQSGMLELGHVNAAGTGTIVLGNSGTGSDVTQLRVGASIANDIVVSATAPNSSAAIGASAALPILTGALQVDRDLTIQGATDRITWSGSGALWSGSGDITVAVGTGGQNRVTHQGVANTWTGNMTINNGAVFQPGHASTLTAFNSVAVNGILQLNDVSQTIDGLSGSGTVRNIVGANTLTVGTGGATTEFLGVIADYSGALELIKDGEGILTLSGPLNHTGGTVVDGGILVLNGGGNSMDAGQTGQFGSSGQTITVNSGATLRLTEQWVLGDGGQHHLIADGGTIDFHTRDNYQNSMELTGGAVTTRGDGRPWRTGYNGGDALITINPSDVSSTISGLLCFVRTVTGAPGKTTFDVANGEAEHDLIVSATISDHPGLGGMVLVKDGPGTMVLSGANTFIGGVNISAGTLLVNNTSGSGTGTGPVAVKEFATLGGTGTIAGATTIEGGGTLATGTPTTAMGIGRLTFENDLSFEDGAIWDWDWDFINNIDGNYDQAVGPNLILPTEGTVRLNIRGLDGHTVGWYDEFTLFTGQVANFDAKLFQLENHSDWTRGWTISLGNSLVLTAVPEPGTWLLLLSALVSGLLVRRR